MLLILTDEPNLSYRVPLLCALETMVNSKVHSLERTRRCSGLRAVTVLQWWPKPYQVTGGWCSQATAIIYSHQY